MGPYSLGRTATNDYDSGALADDCNWAHCSLENDKKVPLDMQKAEEREIKSGFQLTPLVPLPTACTAQWGQ